MFRFSYIKLENSVFFPPFPSFCSAMGVLGQCFSSVRAVFPTKGHNLRSDLQRDDQNFKEGGCHNVEHQTLLSTMNCFSFC